MTTLLAQARNVARPERSPTTRFLQFWTYFTLELVCCRQIRSYPLPFDPCLPHPLPPPTSSVFILSNTTPSNSIPSYPLLSVLVRNPLMRSHFKPDFLPSGPFSTHPLLFFHHPPNPGLCRSTHTVSISGQSITAWNRGRGTVVSTLAKFLGPEQRVVCPVPAFFPLVACAPQWTVLWNS